MILYVFFIHISFFFVFFGFILVEFPPKRINGIYGYRTLLSMKNQDTWKIAQRNGGITMIVLGIIYGILGILLVNLPASINTYNFERLFLVLGVIVMIIVDEIRLRKIFNKDGSRKIN